MILSKRETRAYLLLTKISSANRAGKEPSKADMIIEGTPNQTRADHYRIIDKLINRKLVENVSTGMAYRLKITALGESELDQWSRS